MTDVTDPPDADPVTALPDDRPVVGAPARAEGRPGDDPTMEVVIPAGMTVAPDDGTDLVPPGFDDPLPPVRPRLRVGPLTLGLAFALVAALGALGGARWQKANEPAPAAAVSFAGFAGRNGGGAGGGNGGGAGRGGAANAANATSANAGGSAAADGRAAAPSGAGTATGTTTGKVTLVDGANVYVTDDQGNVVKAVTSAGTAVTVGSPGSVDQLKAGDTVTVQGDPRPDGSESATRIVVAQPAG